VTIADAEFGVVFESLAPMADSNLEPERQCTTDSRVAHLRQEFLNLLVVTVAITHNMLV